MSRADPMLMLELEIRIFESIACDHDQLKSQVESRTTRTKLESST